MKRPTNASTEVHTKVSSQVVEVHLSCFHLFCSSARKANLLRFTVFAGLVTHTILTEFRRPIKSFSGIIWIPVNRFIAGKILSGNLSVL